MTTANELIKSKWLMDSCETNHFSYSIRNGQISLHADSKYYKEFTEDNNLFSCETVEEALAWLTGARGGFSIALNKKRK